MTTPLDSPPPTALRPGPFFWIGLVLWIAVFAGLAMMWMQRLLPRATVELRPVGDEDRPAHVANDGSGAFQIDLSQGSATIDPAALLRGQGAGAALRPDGSSAVRHSNETDSLWSEQGIDDFSPTRSDGTSITKQDLLGAPWAVAFVFTNCRGPCPTITRKMKDLQDRLGDRRYHLVSITVDPQRDTPEVLEKYAAANGARADRWYFLTGDQKTIYDLIQTSFRMPVQEAKEADGTYDVIHSIWILLVDAQGVVRGKFNANKDEEMAQLRRELQKRADAVAQEDSPADATRPTAAP